MIWIALVAIIAGIILMIISNSEDDKEAFIISILCLIVGCGMGYHTAWNHGATAIASGKYTAERIDRGDAVEWKFTENRK